MELGRKKSWEGQREGTKERAKQSQEKNEGACEAVMGETEMCLLVNNVTITPTVCFFLELLRGARGRELG